MFFKPKSKHAPAMTLEGVLGPNNRLDDAAGISVTDPDALSVGHDGQLLFSSGNAVYQLEKWGGTPRLWARFEGAVTALCVSPSGHVAVGLAGAGLALRDAKGQALDGWADRGAPVSIVDMMFISDDELVLVDNGYATDDVILSLAPWDDVARGQVIRIARSGAAQVMARDLHCPMGLSIDAHGHLLVALLERAGIADLSGQLRQSGYPAYLGRLRKTATGYVMACLSRRDPLIEFLKTETAFVAEMKANIEPRHWISPRARPEFSHDFPIELGATRLYGDIKPWAPSFSYGLVIELDEHLMPVASAHSRANGQRHEIADALVWQGELVAVSRASGELLRLPMGGPRS